MGTDRRGSHGVIRERRLIREVVIVRRARRRRIRTPTWTYSRSLDRPRMTFWDRGKAAEVLRKLSEGRMSVASAAKRLGKSEKAVITAFWRRYGYMPGGGVPAVPRRPNNKKLELLLKLLELLG